MQADDQPSPRDPAPVAPAHGDGPVPGRRPSPGELLRFLPDVARLLFALARDPRVPWYAKAAAVGAAAYVASPVDLVPDALPVLGQLDDAWLVAKALRFLLREAGQDVLVELWSGSDEGFAVLLWVAGVRD